VFFFSTASYPFLDVPRGRGLFLCSSIWIIICSRSSVTLSPPLHRWWMKPSGSSSILLPFLGVFHLPDRRGHKMADRDVVRCRPRSSA